MMLTRRAASAASRRTSAPRAFSGSAPTPRSMHAGTTSNTAGVACHAAPTGTASATTSAPAPAAPRTLAASSAGPQTLSQFLVASGTPTQLILVFQAIQAASKIIAAKVARAGLEDLGAVVSSGGDGDRDAQKALDVVANEVIISQLASSGVVGLMASEEEDDAIVVDAEDRGKLVVTFDPLDGSSNISASIPTGSIFGVYRRTAGGSAAADVLQPGSAQVAAAYTLYSSATMLVLTVGSGTHGFTLDPSVGEFVLTHPHVKVPARGQFYSLNDARFEDWPAGLQRYISAIRSGKGQSGKQYSARYVCSLVADVHRTLLYGGWAANPRSHLRLVFEAAPLSFLCEQAGGKGTDGKGRILDLVPSKLHHRLPFWAGSRDDIDELLSYGDVQQTGTKKYEV